MEAGGGACGPRCGQRSGSSGTGGGARQPESKRHRQDRGDGAQIEYVDVADHQRLVRLRSPARAAPRVDRLAVAGQRVLPGISLYGEMASASTPWLIRRCGPGSPGPWRCRCCCRDCGSGSTSRPPRCGARRERSEGQEAERPDDRAGAEPLYRPVQKPAPRSPPGSSRTSTNWIRRATRTARRSAGAGQPCPSRPRRIIAMNRPIPREAEQQADGRHRFLLSLSGRAASAPSARASARRTGNTRTMPSA